MTKKPVFLLAGGRHSRRKGADPLLQAVFRESGKESPSVAYVGTASGDDKSFFGFVTSAFKEAGAGDVKHAVISPENADLDKARKILDSADIIFFSGGDVEAGMEVLKEKGFIDFLSGIYNRGIPFFGLSAGSIMLADEWVRWPDPDDEASAELFPCLGFAPVICDTHDEDGGWEELQAALALGKPGTHGYGIATGTGIKVYPDGTVEALGGPVFQYIRQSGKVKRIDDIRPLLSGNK
jgi:cyanophycinase-like exopeptidase